MRGEICVGAASVLSLISLILLIFAHVGQINTASVPRGVYMARVDTSGYLDAIRAAIAPDEPEGVYATNDTVPLQQGDGLRTTYDFGLYSYCGRLNGTDTHGLCSNQTAAFEFQPHDIMLSDLSGRWRIITNAIILDTNTFRDSSYLGHNTKAAYYMILLGSILTALAFLTRLFKHTGTYLASAISSIFGALMLLVGAAIWTVIIHKANGVSKIVISGSNTPIGVSVSVGPGLLLVWAAFAVLTGSIIPSMITCITYRG
jgi:hypothetical protein